MLVSSAASVSLNCSRAPKENDCLTLYPWSPPVAFQANEIRKEPCRPVYYGMGDGDGVLDPQCYDLQRKLIDAAIAGEVERMKELLRAGANARATAGDSISPLQWAARNGHLNAALLLLDNGADVNHFHPISGTPLSGAIYGGHADMVKLLLSRGANPYIVSEGTPPLTIARKQNNREMVALLERAGAKE